MREEANLEKWKELYEVAANIKSLSPWDYLWDSDLISIRLKDRDEPVFCSIMGHGGECVGIGVYDGIDGLADFDMIARSNETGLPLDYIMFEQSNLSCYFGNRDEVPNEQKKLIKALDIKFRGDGNWLYFESYKKGYMPFILDNEEVVFLTEVYKNLCMALRALIVQKLKVDFEKGNCLCRMYNKEKELWLNFEAPLPKVKKKYPQVKLTDELVKQKLKKQPKVNAQIIIDVSYMNVFVEDPEYDRPLNPLIFLVMDASDGIIIHMDTLNPDDDVPNTIINFIGNYIMRYGRMKTIVARIPIILAVLEDTCNYCEIKLLKDDRKMKMMDQFLTGLRSRMM